jgi:hypothetical protein
MKIAVCISGQYRAYKQGYEYLKRNLLDKYDCDIFIHSWFNNDIYPADNVRELYKPVRWSFQMPISDEEGYDDIFTNVPGAGWYPPTATISMFYSMFQTLRMKCEYELKHSHYDFVVRTRFDYALNGVIPFNMLDTKNIYIPNCRMVPTKDFGNDQFAFGSNRVMNEYMSTYLYMRQFYDEGIQMIGEDMMSANLKRAGLVGNRLEYVNMNNPFPPGPYNGTPHSLIRDDMHLWKKS